MKFEWSLFPPVQDSHPCMYSLHWLQAVGSMLAPDSVIPQPCCTNTHAHSASTRFCRLPCSHVMPHVDVHVINCARRSLHNADITLGVHTTTNTHKLTHQPGLCLSDRSGSICAKCSR